MELDIDILTYQFYINVLIIFLNLIFGDTHKSIVGKDRLCNVHFGRFVTIYYTHLCYIEHAMAC